MTVYFAGTEREALQQGAAGTYSEDADTDDMRAAYSRASSKMSGTSEYVCNFSDDLSELFFHCVVARTGTGAGDGDWIEFRDSSNDVLVRLRSVSQNFTLQYWNGSAYVDVGSGVVLATGAERFVFTVHIKKHASAGVVEWWNAGVLVDTTGDIALTSYGDINNVRLSRSTISNNFYSEIVVADESVTDWGCLTVPPSANGTDTDGTGAVGDVNELNMSTATYLEFDTAAQKRSFIHAAIAVENYVKGVGVACCARRVDGSGPQQIRPYLIIGGVRYYGSTFALTTGFLNYQYVWSVNPDTGVAWITDDVNDSGFEMGWEAVA